MINRIKKFWQDLILLLFKKRKNIRLGLYGAPNSGKTTLANRMCKDVTGEKLGKVSKVPHETREFHEMPEMKIDLDGKELTFTLIDTPGIATNVDYEEFLKFGISKKRSKKRAIEATQGVIDAIQKLEEMDAVIVLIDSSKDALTQVNLTIISTLHAKKIPFIIAGNKCDLRRADIEAVQESFPDYTVVGISAKKGTGLDKLYKALIDEVYS